jgi:hypothetical protein
MSFRFEKLITRWMVRNNPKTLFVFGDNMLGRGGSGQARAMRGEDNVVGIPTKWRPSMLDNAFFTDGDFLAVRETIDARFQQLTDHLEAGGDVVWPTDGIGTGYAQLQQRAPLVLEYIESKRKALETIT